MACQSVNPFTGELLQLFVLKRKERLARLAPVEMGRGSRKAATRRNSAPRSSSTTSLTPSQRRCLVGEWSESIRRRWSDRLEWTQPYRISEGLSG